MKIEIKTDLQMNLNALIHLSKNFQPESYLEIGVQEGNSLNLVIEHSKKLNKIVLCDTWQGEFGGTSRGSNEHIKNRFKNHLDKITFLDGDSKLQIPKLTEKFDLIHVDGDHSYEGAMLDLNNCFNLLNKDGFLVFDDITHPSHRDLLVCAEEFHKNHPALKKVYFNDEHPFGVIIFQL